MAMVVNHNIPALQTYNTVNRTNDALTKSIQKLSTGLRINSAADDAAGLAISEKMRSQINGMDRAVSNAQDGISMIQTAEGALNETHSILQRMRELSVQAANDTLTSQDRGYIQLEIDQLREEVTRIGNTTQFNKKKLLNGDAAVLWSSSDLSTKAIVNGGLRSLDQFGQKVVTEGNYNISIKSDPGQGEVQKSDIFKIKHENVVMNKSINSLAGAKDVDVTNVPAGSYKMTATAAPTAVSTVADANITGQYKIHAGEVTVFTGETTLDAAKAADNNAAGGADVGKKVQLYYDDKLLGEVTIENAAGGGAWTEQLIGEKLAAAVTTNNTGTKRTEWGLESLSVSCTGGKFNINARASGDQSSKTFSVKVVDSGGNDASLTTADPTTITASGTKADRSLAEALTMTVTDANLKGNANILFEVTDYNEDNKSITLKATANILGVDGTTELQTYENIVLSEKDTAARAIPASFLSADGKASSLSLQLKENMLSTFEKGSKFVVNIGKNADATVGVQISGTQDQDWDEKWGTSVTKNPVNYGLDDTKVAGTDIHFKNYYLNEKTGEATEGDIILTTNSDFKAANLTEGTSIASFDAAYVGKVAVGDVNLRDLDKFWTSEGVFMLDDPKTITLTQGNGKQATVTLYATDTLDDVKNKLNTAIGEGLGQNKYVDDATHFAAFVEDAGKNSESVEGTFLIRSIVPGAEGTIRFSGDENIINAFSLNTIQNASESKYTVNIKDAHTGAEIASEVQVTGNKLVGVINPNVDVEFDSLAGLDASWDASRNAFVYKQQTKPYETTLHLSDNTTVFQIGANEGEDMGVHIGDMRATALGIDKVLVTDRESASRSITILDNAIDKVSMQRAKLGAYQNRLEHTINNLNTASENITAAESRIRDTDMAKEMMNFTKLQIMLQAGNSMLAQANQLPQNVMSLIR